MDGVVVMVKCLDKISEVIVIVIKCMIIVNNYIAWYAGIPEFGICKMIMI